MLAGWIKKKNQWKAIFLLDLVYDFDLISTDDLLTFVCGSQLQLWLLRQITAVYVTQRDLFVNNTAVFTENIGGMCR